jgi:hypothetical protein
MNGIAQVHVAVANHWSLVQPRALFHGRCACCGRVLTSCLGHIVSGCRRVVAVGRSHEAARVHCGGRAGVPQGTQSFQPRGSYRRVPCFLWIACCDTPCRSLVGARCGWLLCCGGGPRAPPRLLFHSLPRCAAQAFASEALRALTGAEGLRQFSRSGSVASTSFPGELGDPQQEPIVRALEASKDTGSNAPPPKRDVPAAAAVRLCF